MNEPGEQVAVTCPACSPARSTAHEILSGGGSATVRCRSCGHVHATALGGDTSTIDVRTVISQGGESLVASVAVPPDGTLAVGQEFVVESDEAAYAVEVTSVEGHDDERHDRLPADEVATVWTRDVGNVAVDVTVHPPERADERTRSSVLRVPGDQRFEVGAETTVEDEPVQVTGILRRESAVEAGPRKLDHPGDRVAASDVARLYVRSQRHVPRSPW